MKTIKKIFKLFHIHFFVCKGYGRFGEKLCICRCGETQIKKTKRSRGSFSYTIFMWISCVAISTSYCIAVVQFF